MAIEINWVEISSHVDAKINGKHHVSAGEVEQACDQVVRAGWEQDNAGTWRVIGVGRTASDRRIAFFLYPIEGESGAWRLATAYPEPR